MLLFGKIPRGIPSCWECGATRMELLVATAKTSERVMRDRGDLLHIRNATVADRLARVSRGRAVVAEKISRGAWQLFSSTTKHKLSLGCGPTAARASWLGFTPQECAMIR